jgi:hypothetical protein
MKAIIYGEGTEQVGTVELTPQGSAVVKTDNPNIRAWMREIKVPASLPFDGKFLTPKDGAKYIQGLEIYGPRIEVVDA